MPRVICIFFVGFLLVTLAGSRTATGAQPHQQGNAEGWNAVITDYRHAPSFLIAVDKKEQLLSVFERRSPFAKTAEYVCTTGQNQGDKLLEGDLKTPEGVYFVISHIKFGLDYTLYGREAYPLNYPNPVDRLRKKTGYGIWIHGKGIPIVPYDSNGCVGMFNHDIATFEQKPIIGQPVTMAKNIEHQAVPDAEKAVTAEKLARKVEDWAKAWSGRSPEMFDFYDAEAYSMAQGQTFKAFRQQKESLFKTLPWINTTVRDIQILEGPGYWVTWFNQDYKAPNLSTWGTRRLYWQPGADGELRIVGMEWLTGFTSPLLYAEATPEVYTDATAPAPAPVPATVAAATPAPATATTPAPLTPNDAAQIAVNADMLMEARAFVNAWHGAWQQRDLEAYASCYAQNARQGNRSGLKAIRAHKTLLWANVEVQRLELDDIVIEPSGRGFKATMRQNYADSKGYADDGVKILYLEYDQNWRILREDWQPPALQ